MKLFWKYRVPILLATIFLLGTVIRFAGLGSNPIGLVADEAENGYDAYSLIKTGKDQWGAPWPVTSLRGFGDYRLPAYTYLSIPSVAIFGLTPFAVRFPSALFGSLSIIAIFLLAKELFKGRTDLALLSAFFLAISPWHIGLSRVAIEQAVSVCVITTGLLTLLIGSRRPQWIVVSGIVFGLSLFVYRPNIVLVPFLTVSIVLLYRKSFYPFWKYLAAGCISLLFVSSPILFSLDTSAFQARVNQTNITNDKGIIDLVNEKRGACLRVLPDALCRVVFTKYSAFGGAFVSNYLHHFSPDLLSMTGTETQYSVLPSRGLLYLLDYPLLLLAVVAVVYEWTPAGIFLLGFLLFSAVPDSMTSAGHYGRYFISFPVWPLLLSFGLGWTLSRVTRGKAFLVILIGIYALAASNFLIEYWTFFPYRYSVYTHFGYEALTHDIVRSVGKYDRIILSSRANDSKQYIYYLFYTAYDPAAFQSGVGVEKVQEPNSWVRVRKIGHIEFLPILPPYPDISREHNLLIGDPSEFTAKDLHISEQVVIPVEFTVKDKAGNILFEGVDSGKL